MSIIDRSARTLFLTELLSGMALTFRYLFKKRATINYPYEKGRLSPALPRRTCAAPLSQRRGTMHRV